MNLAMSLPVFTLAVALASPAHAQSVEEFYKSSL
jgi:hypothetical protein